MDFNALLTLIALAAVVVLLPVALFFLYPRKPVLPAPSLREYLPGGIVFPMFYDFRNTGDTMDKLRETYGETFVVWLGPTRTVMTSSPKDVTQVLRSSEFIRPDNVRAAFHAIAPNGISATIGEWHRATRKSMRAYFDSTMLQTFHQNMTKATTELCDTLSEAAGKDPIDIWKSLAMNSIRVITDVAFGADFKREERVEFNNVINALIKDILKEIHGFPVLQKLGIFGVRENFMKNVTSMRTICRLLIEKRLAESSKRKNMRNPDVLDTVIEISGGDISTAISLAIDLGIGGSHTVNQLLTWTVYELCCKPEVENRLYNELDTVVGYKPISEPVSFEDMQKLKYCMQIWKEALRRRPIGALVSRKAIKDVRLDGSGVHLPKGAAVAALYAYCQSDPQIWKDPFEFRPERWEEDGKSEGYRVPVGAYMPFGAGEFSCAGKFLADYEGPLVIAELYRRFKFELACKPDEVRRRSQFIEVPQYVHGDVEEGMPVKVSLRAK